MDEKEYFPITEKVYKKFKDFWDQELPNQLSKDLVLTGKNTLISSIEMVSFLGELETELLNYSINISFLDKVLEINE